MAEMRVFDAIEDEFLQAHPRIIWESGMPVFYRHVPDETGQGDRLQRYDVYVVLKLR